MFKRGHQKNREGSVLILAVWTVLFLSIFAARIGLRIRQRATLASRLETRSKLHFIAEAGIKKAIAGLRVDLVKNKGIYSSFGKYYRHNNGDEFKNIIIGEGVSEVTYIFHRDFNTSEKRYGFVDEERKININVVDLVTLTRLIQQVSGLDENKSQGIAEAIIDWREIGKTQTTGFYSDDYYSNLEYPYEPKNGDFELIDELLLIKGIDKNIFNTLRDFITIYGDGKVNINTASAEVLSVLGLSSEVINKLFLARRGVDGIEDTADDYVFQRTYDIASEMKSFVKLKLNEVKQINDLNKFGLIKTNSSFYFIESKGVMSQKKDTLNISCLYNAEENKIEYWREK